MQTSTHKQSLSYLTLFSPHLLSKLLNKHVDLCLQQSGEDCFKLNSINSDYKNNADDDKQVAVSSSSSTSSDSHALANVNSSTSTFKAQRYGKEEEGVVQFRNKYQC